MAVIPIVRMKHIESKVEASVSVDEAKMRSESGWEPIDLEDFAVKLEAYEESLKAFEIALEENINDLPEPVIKPEPTPEDKKAIDDLIAANEKSADEKSAAEKSAAEPPAVTPEEAKKLAEVQQVEEAKKLAEAQQVEEAKKLAEAQQVGVDPEPLKT